MDREDRDREKRQIWIEIWSWGDRCRQIAGCVKERAWHVEEEKIDGGP